MYCLIEIRLSATQCILVEVLKSQQEIYASTQSQMTDQERQLFTSLLHPFTSLRLYKSLG